MEAVRPTIVHVSGCVGESRHTFHVLPPRLFDSNSYATSAAALVEGMYALNAALVARRL